MAKWILYQLINRKNAPDVLNMSSAQFDEFFKDYTYAEVTGLEADDPDALFVKTQSLGSMWWENLDINCVPAPALRSTKPADVVVNVETGERFIYTDWSYVRI